MTRTPGVVLAITLAPIFFGAGTVATAAEIKVLSANGVKAIMIDLTNKYESSTGNKMA
jgi:hypothetical protein